MNAYNVTIKISGKGLNVKPKTVTGLALAKNRDNAGLSALSVAMQSFKIKDKTDIQLTFEVKKIVSVPATFIVNESILTK
jgi:hypothetical protein